MPFRKFHAAAVHAQDAEVVRPVRMFQFHQVFGAGRIVRDGLMQVFLHFHQGIVQADRWRGTNHEKYLFFDVGEVPASGMADKLHHQGIGIVSIGSVFRVLPVGVKPGNLRRVPFARDQAFRRFPGERVEERPGGFGGRFRVLDAVASRQHTAFPLLTGTVMRGETGMQPVDALQKSGRAQQLFPEKDEQVVRRQFHSSYRVNQIGNLVLARIVPERDMPLPDPVFIARQDEGGEVVRRHSLDGGKDMAVPVRLGHEEGEQPVQVSRWRTTRQTAMELSGVLDSETA